MPIPLPNLDTRRWADMVDEGRALIPRYSPTWNDHNIHDPGITIMELLAWLVEQDIYRVNRIPERHLRKFLALAGFLPQPPLPAQVPVSFTLLDGAPAQTIPSGFTVATGGETTALRRFRTLQPLTIVPVQIEAVQVFDGAIFTDQTRLWRDALPFPLLRNNPQPQDEDDPEQQPAFYMGFDDTLPPGEAVTLWFWFTGGRSDRRERDRILEEAQQAEVACQPMRPQITCTPMTTPLDAWCPDEETDGDASNTDDGDTPDGAALPLHHTVRTVWEYPDSQGWRVLDADASEIADTTRGFTLDGMVRVTLPSAMESRTLGEVDTPHFYLRCRLVAGPPDAAPVLAGLAINTVATEQTSPARSSFTIAPGVTVPSGQEPVAGSRQNIHLKLDETGVITELAAGPDVVGPEAFVLDYQASTTSGAGILTITLVSVGVGTGLPQQQVTLPDAPIANGQVQLWTLASTGFESWEQRPDLDAAKRVDAHFTLDATGGVVTFGDGENGRVVPANAPILVAYEVTTGAEGNLPAKTSWHLVEADDALNQALWGGGLDTLDNALETLSNLFPADGGADAETVFHAAGRAAESLWAHERLLELCETNRCSSLDQLQRDAVLARTSPPRATTLLDFERIALEVPGTWVSRAKAWGSIDPFYPCAKAPGTVTLIIVPALPAGHPEPTPGHLDVVWRYLHRRRIIGTRLVVVGPTYLTVRVRATVRAKTGVDPVRAQAQVVADLNTFLDPLQGGPDGLGWPFGRDVYRSEILQVIDNVSGIDHVLSLELMGGEEEAQCGNLCVAPTWLVTPGQHAIEVVTGEST